MSLAGLLLVPLLISPALLGIRRAFDTVARRTQSDDELVELLVIIGSGFAYTAVLTVFWYRRRNSDGLFDKARPFVWCLLRGAFCGALFGALMFFPALATQGVIDAHRMKTSGLVAVLQPDGSVDWNAEFRHLVLLVSGMATIILLTFTLIGGAAGGLLGLLLRRQNNVTQGITT